MQNQLLDDMKAEFQEFPGRRVYTAVEREGVPSKDVDRPSAVLRAVEEEEDRASALLPTVPLMTSPPPQSIAEIDSESQHSLRGALHSESAESLVSHSISSFLSTDRTYREVCHHYNAHLQQKQRNKYNRLGVNDGWRTISKTRKKIYLESELKERH